jgi:two-component system, LytTR family, response regulator LytT
MNQLNILIVEDELIVAEDIKCHLQKMGYTIIGIAASYDEAVRFLANTSPDLILLDIMIKGPKSGIEVGKYIQDNQYNVPFIYLTSLSDKKTIELAKETHPNGYLMKPFRAENLFASIEIAIENAASKNTDATSGIQMSNMIVKDSLFIKKDSIFFKVKLKEILFFKGEGNYIEIYTEKDKYIIRATIKNIMDHLGKFHFFQTHRSYIINIEYLDAISYTFVKIRQHEVPLATNKKNELLALMTSFS